MKLLILFISDGPLTYARKLAKDLVSWATKGDKQKVNLLCGDLLGWINHIVDVSQHVIPHCTQENKKRSVLTLYSSRTDN